MFLTGMVILVAGLGLAAPLLVVMGGALALVGLTLFTAEGCGAPWGRRWF